MPHHSYGYQTGKHFNKSRRKLHKKIDWADGALFGNGRGPATILWYNKFPLYHFCYLITLITLQLVQSFGRNKKAASTNQRKASFLVSETIERLLIQEIRTLAK